MQMVGQFWMQINRKATIDQGKVAVKKARAAGIDTNGFLCWGSRLIQRKVCKKLLSMQGFWS